MGSKGRVQDKQNRMRLDRVTHFGISCGDKIEGPFDLEIEYVGKLNVRSFRTRNINELHEKASLEKEEICLIFKNKHSKW